MSYTALMEIGTNTIQCEILASNESLRTSLKCIAQTCAIDLGLEQPLNTIEKSTRNEPAVVLSIPAEFAILNDGIWSLARRLACFCPNARVSTCIQMKIEP